MKITRRILITISIVSLLAGILIFLFTGGLNHNILPLISQGEKFLGEEQFEEAELAFARAINIDPKTARAYYGQARAALGMGNDEEAIQLLSTVAELSPDKQDKVDWMIDKIQAGEGDQIILLPFRTDVTSDDEFQTINITSDDREIVVILDKSGSMDGTPIEETKQASKRFVQEILSQYADIGLVAFNDEAELLSDFTMNEASLDEALDNLHAGGGTATAAGLEMANEMLSTSGARNKIIVLMSDGESGDDPLPIAQQIKDSGMTIYTLGFFDSVSDKAYVQSIMEGIASDGCHYEVDDESSLQDFFADIASQINGEQYYYIRIACPVDVTVEYDGEKLESKGMIKGQRASFGTLTFEENEKSEEFVEETTDDSNNETKSRDDRIKVLRLKEGVDYDITISGNGKGKMNYTIGFMDDDGNYSDIREFKSIPVTKKTEIYTEAADTDTTTLEVDSNGDGKIDEEYVAKENSKGEKVDYSKYIKIGAIALISLVGFIVVLVIIGKIRKRIRRS